MSTQSKRRWFLGLVFFVIIGVGGYSFSFIKDIAIIEVNVPDSIEQNRFVSRHLPSSTQDSSLEKEEIGGHLMLAFVGDIMLDRGVKSSVYKNFDGDYSQLFIKVLDRLQKYDLLFGNLEGPVSDKGIDGGNIYSFRMEPAVLPALKEGGFDGFSIENNHILNYGLEALADTKIRLAENGFRVIGEKSYVISEVKIAILPFNEFAGLDLEKMGQEISLAKITNDLVVAYFHFGEEYQVEPNEYQKMISKMAIEAGTDLVVGTHPHVVQNLEQYKNGWIAYSLGNFIFDQYFSPETMQGGLLEVEVNLNNKQIEKITLKKVFLNKMFQIENIE
jgi:poly-gamma-glutamate capsule biosynthesis protein CapA/YwtB (metallophosphatase superfamily)